MNFLDELKQESKREKKELTIPGIRNILKEFTSKYCKALRYNMLHGRMSYD